MASSPPSEELPGERLAAVVYNPVKVDVERLRRAVARSERVGWRTTLWLETSEADPGTGQARAAVEAGAEVVLAAGGDGTVRAVAEGLRGSPAALAPIPVGTGNLLARNLELSLARLEDGVLSAFTGVDREIDLAVVEIERPDGSRDEHAFAVMAGVGLDAQMVANTNPELKRRVGWLAYVDGIARSLRDEHKIRVRWRIDGAEPRANSVHTLLIGNCGVLPGNVVLLPEARIDDGVLDVVALRPEGFAGWLRIWTEITWENGVRRLGTAGRKLAGPRRPVRALRYLRGREFEVGLERPEPVELDGDAFGEAIGFHVRVDPGSLRVRTPAAQAHAR